MDIFNDVNEQCICIFHKDEKLRVNLSLHKFVILFRIYSSEDFLYMSMVIVSDSLQKFLFSFYHRATILVQG